MRLRLTGTVFGLSLALFVALCCLTADAQSGRRQAKPPAAAPVPSPTPEPTPKPAPKRDNDNEFSFLVASGDRATAFSNLPLTFYEAAAIGCADQLAKRTSLAVYVSQRELNRGEAIGRAKSSKTTYVVLITLIEDRMSASSSNYPELEVDYVVFAPETAKVVATGRTHENSARKGPISVGRPRGTSLPSYREALLRRAGEDAADRIVKSLHLSDPPKTKTS